MIQQLKLRPYQERDVKLIEESLTKNTGTLYQLPTGGGKTVVVSSIVYTHKDENILILAHKRKLITQMKSHLNSRNLTVGLLMGEQSENLNSNIIASTINTASKDKRIESLLERKWDKIIIDEAHRTRTPSYEKLIDAFVKANPKIVLLGVTATPYREDKKPLDKYYQELICSDDVQTLTKAGYLANYKVFYTPLGDIDSEVQKTESDYVVQALSTYMRKPRFLEYLVESYKREGKEKQTIIFCVDKSHAKSVIETYKKHGYNKIEYIDSDTKEVERERIFKDYETKVVQIIVCIETLTEGVDLPETGCIQLARPTKSLVLYLQMAGRGLRPKQDGSELIILDCGGCTEEHGVPSSKKHWSLNGEIHPNNPSKKNKVVGRRKDGTYTEEDSEMEFCELVEMTPEEYLLNISGNVDSAKEENNKIEEQVKQILLDLGQEILRKNKLTNYQVIINEGVSYSLQIKFVKSSINLKDKELNIDYSYNSIRLEKKFDRRQSNEVSFISNLGYSVSERGNIKAELECLVLQGKLAEYLLVDINSKHISQITEECYSLLESKVDINELKKIINKFKDEQLLKKLETHLLSNQTYKLKQDITLDAWFSTNVVGWRVKCSEIRFSKPKLLSTNEVEFLRNGVVEHVVKFMEKPKLLEILRWSENEN